MKNYRRISLFALCTVLFALVFTLFAFAESATEHKVVCTFDSNENITGDRINNLTIRHENDLEIFCKENKVDTAFLCIPKVCVENILDKLYSLGIKNFWNFSHYDINTKYNDTLVENVHLSDSLMTLCYKMNNRK